jgi:hypothetical protein
MSKPASNGITFFSVDCNFDNKISMYLLETNGVGLAVLVTLWQLIYSNEGYYIENNKDLALLIKQRINDDIYLINDCINKAVERNIFNKELYEKYSILTSNAIQKRYFDAAKRKKQINVIEEYLLKNINVNILPINVNIYSINAKNICIDATKEKEKEKEKVKEDNTAEKINFSEKVDKKSTKKSSPKKPEEINEELPTAKTITSTNNASENDIVKESKVKESKVKNNKDSNNISNFAASVNENEVNVDINPINVNKKSKNVNKKPDFINQLIELFSAEYKKVKGIDYDVTSLGKERQNMQAILTNYKEKNPNANTEKALIDFKDFFEKCLTVTDAWLIDNCTIPHINSQFAKYKAQIYGKKAEPKKALTTTKTERKEQLIQDWNSGKIFENLNKNIKSGVKNETKLQLPNGNA